MKKFIVIKDNEPVVYIESNDSTLSVNADEIIETNDSKDVLFNGVDKFEMKIINGQKQFVKVGKKQTTLKDK